LASSESGAATAAAEKQDQRQQSDEEKQWVHSYSAREREDKQDHGKSYNHLSSFPVVELPGVKSLKP
jgi:hypothetical protein